jgi:hypothetical protein
LVTGGAVGNTPVAVFAPRSLFAPGVLQAERDFVASTLHPTCSPGEDSEEEDSEEEDTPWLHARR